MSPQPSNLDELLAAEGLEYVGANTSLAARMPVETGDIAKIRPLGFGGTQTVGIGATVTFTDTPQRAATIKSLIAAASVLLSDLSITSIKVGDKEQLLGGAVSAEMYAAAVAGGGYMDDFDAIPANTRVSITVTNNNAAAQDVSFSARCLCNAG